MSVHQYLSINENIDVILIHLVDDHYSLLFMYMCFISHLFLFSVRDCQHVRAMFFTVEMFSDNTLRDSYTALVTESSTV